ncbi:hypothetical protein MVQ23_02780 [Fusobacterium necrophorum]|uniref:hypothetical protein n=1 Tax=Fusobacterium necrophorum TaxID=859 RepID=UPI0007879913|nr:hypothetical protein [Fusobacterium necrophorum]KYM50709.1 hypothetical protein A2U11_08350 [Fusobacterium necrophorum subsp. funduliforme]MDK4484787.1 hypothetical protein [Fusobacterium necrophorum]
MIEEVIKGLPLHFQKENNIKFYRSLNSVIDYIDSLANELKNQTSLLKCNGIFLDFMGDRYDEKRQGRDDETYRQALIIKKSALDGLPNTEFLLEISRKLTQNEVVAMETRYKGEVASQNFRIDMTEQLKHIALMPDLNKVCEAGARMYWDLEIIKEICTLNMISGIQFIKEIQIKADFALDQTMKIHDDFYHAIGIGFTKIIEIRGIR